MRKINNKRNNYFLKNISVTVWYIAGPTSLLLSEYVLFDNYNLKIKNGYNYKKSPISFDLISLFI